MNTDHFLNQLLNQAEQQQQLVQLQIAPLSTGSLNMKPAADSWSILECLEHLNRYSRFYHVKLSNSLQSIPDKTAKKEFTFSWLGKKSVDQISPKNMKKQKTLKHMNPNNSLLTLHVVDEFLQHQQHLIDLLKEAQTKNISKKVIPVEFFRLLKLSIGDAFAFVLEHQERHLQQAMRVKQLTNRIAA